MTAITGWTAAGAAALTAGLAFGAARGQHAAASAGNGTAVQERTTPEAATDGAYVDPSAGASQGFTPPSASTEPAQAMSGGS